MPSTVIYPTSKIAVIGAGFAGMASASIMALNGSRVTVFEKNESVGGRARTFESDGFSFDMGPSWYWMPDVYEKFFNLFGRASSDFYTLKKLDPGFAVIFDNSEVIDIPADFEDILELFEQIEPGSSAKLKKFMAEAEVKYRIGMGDMVYKPGHSLMEFISLKLFRDALKLQLFSSYSKHVRSYFKDPRLIAIIEFPVLFLGAMPRNTPALYSLMNFAAFKQGTFYPVGGFGKVADAFADIARNAGVEFQTGRPVTQFEIKRNFITHLHWQDGGNQVDAVIGAADYHHIEHNMIGKNFRSYPESYWESRTFAPSCLLFYLGINKKINKLRHHNLFFDADFEKHAEEIYKQKVWPTDPLFYVCCPSKTDESVAPENCENLFVLMPIAIGLSDEEQTREKYYQLLMDRLEKFAGEDIRGHVIFKRSYAKQNFIEDYNAYQGNAYGLANTLRQTAILKPKLKSRKIANLFYAGQLTVPGPGVPPSIISGTIAANELLKFLNS